MAIRPYDPVTAADDGRAHDAVFRYNDRWRNVLEGVVKTTEEGHLILVGREITRGRKVNDQVKQYRVDKIQAVRSIAPTPTVPPGQSTVKGGRPRRIAVEKARVARRGNA